MLRDLLCTAAAVPLHEIGLEEQATLSAEVSSVAQVEVVCVCLLAQPHGNRSLISFLIALC